MIVDIHVHLMPKEFNSPEFWEGWARLGAALADRPVEKARARVPELWDATGDILIKDMDEAGIDKSVFFTADIGLSPLNQPEVNWDQQNREVIAAVRRHPDRLAAFVGIDPRRTGALQYLEMAVKEWGVLGLKVHPGAEIFPNDRACYPIYQKALELGIPVAIHTGSEGPSMRSRYCHPMYVDDVAVDFPDLTIIIAHAGLLWWWDAMAVAAFKPNVYLELAGWQPRVLRGSLEFYQALRTMMNLVGAHRIMFGSDWPVVKLAVSQKQWVQAIKNPPEALKPLGISFTKKEIDGVLGDNAARLLKL